MKKLYTVWGLYTEESLNLPTFIGELVKESKLPSNFALGDVLMGLDNVQNGGASSLEKLKLDDKCVYYLDNGKKFYYRNGDVLKSLDIEEIEVSDVANIEELNKQLLPLGGKKIPVALVNGDGDFEIPSFLVEKVENSDIHVRVALAKEILALDDTCCDDEFDSKIDMLINGEVEYVKMNGVLYFLGGNNYNGVLSLDVDFVDISNEWLVYDSVDGELIKEGVV